MHFSAAVLSVCQNEIQPNNKTVLSFCVINGKNVKRKGRIMRTTLVIMAAGLGLRFGGGIKQLEAAL